MSISPAETGVVAGGSTQFFARVDGFPSSAVTWSVVEAEGGAVDSSGVYVAPASPGSYHVRVTSSSNPSASSQASVKVYPPFDQNQGGRGGFQAGAYQSSAAQPTTYNWTRQSQFTGPNLASVKWTFNAGGSILESPVIGRDGTIYFTCADGRIYALNPDGTPKWAYTTLDLLVSTPTIGKDGTLIFGGATFDGNIYAINPDGTKKWEYHTNYWVGRGLALNQNGTIFSGSGDRNFYSINSNGTLNWVFAAEGRIGCPPVIGINGTIIVGTSDNSVTPYISKLLALSMDGSLIWSMNIGKTIYGPAAINTDHVILIGSFDDTRLFALNPDGTTRWVFDRIFPSGYASAPALAADGTIYVTNLDGKLYALNPNGTMKWAFSTQNSIQSSPLVGADGMIYFGSNDNKVYAVRPDGTLAWTYATGGFVISSPALGADGTLYVGSLDNKMYAFGK